MLLMCVKMNSILCVQGVAEAVKYFVYKDSTNTKEKILVEAKEVNDSG